MTETVPSSLHVIDLLLKVGKQMLHVYNRLLMYSYK